jgi:hypothetical protein
MENNIKKGITQCKFHFWADLIGFTLLAMVTAICMYGAAHWSLILSILCGVGLCLFMILLNRETYYFTYQEIETKLQVDGKQQITDKEYQLTSSVKKLEFLELKLKELDSDPTKTACQIMYVDKRYVGNSNMVTVLPKSEIFKINKFFWKQTFKSIE